MFLQFKIVNSVDNTCVWCLNPHKFAHWKDFFNISRHNVQISAFFMICALLVIFALQHYPISSGLIDILSSCTRHHFYTKLICLIKKKSGEFQTSVLLTWHTDVRGSLQLPIVIKKSCYSLGDVLWQFVRNTAKLGAWYDIWYSRRWFGGGELSFYGGTSTVWQEGYLGVILYSWKIGSEVAGQKYERRRLWLCSISH